MKPPRNIEVNDPGLALVNFVYDSLSVDSEWSVRSERGFSWWGWRLAQTIWADAPEEDDGVLVTRVHARTEYLSDFGEDESAMAALNLLARFATLSGPARNTGDRSRLEMASSVYVHADNLAWIKPLFLASCALQIAEAEATVESAAQVLKATPSFGAHPQNGPRKAPDEMLNIVEASFAPQGHGASRWPRTEFRASSRLLNGLGMLTTESATGLTSEPPFRGGSPGQGRGSGSTSLLQLSSEETHPRLGHGLISRMTIPLEITPEQPADLFLILNETELQTPTRAAFMGSWCLGPIGLTHVSFLPNASYKEGLLPNLCLGWAARSLWAAGGLIGE